MPHDIEADINTAFVRLSHSSLRRILFLKKYMK